MTPAPAPSVSATRRERVVVCVPVEPGDEPFLAPLLDELDRPAAVEATVVLVDLTGAGDLASRWPGRRVVRGVPGSRGGALRAAAAVAGELGADFVAGQLARARALPGRLALQAAALRAAPDRRVATCDLLVRGAQGEADRVVPGDPATDPPACFETALMLRREALDKIAIESFAPAELALVRRLSDANARVHVPEPVACVDADLFRARAARLRQDARLCELARAPHDGPPEVTVLLATHDRRDVFLECLESFARQEVPPGFLEIVAIDDGSRDGTAGVARALALPVPFRFLRQSPADGASRARILGLPHARGRLVLFANDDTIAHSDCVRRHVAAHAELAPRRVTVLGTFEQPAEHLSNALMAMLERSNAVFSYQGLVPGQELPSAWFYTCHVSVELALVRAVGGFDPDFSHYGCEDTDLGVRLERAGVRIVYRPECRALHRHFLPFDVVRRRQRLVAKAHVRLFEKHPDLLDAHPWWAELTADELRRRTAGVAAHLATIESACRALAGVDLAALERGGDACAGLARRVQDRLNDLFPKLNRVWWDQGFLEGLERHGLQGFPELRARARETSTSR